MPDVTPIYNWPIPEDTDLVKDGAEAIRDLAGAIETTVDSSPTGLVHIETQSFSAVASQSINDVFSTTYNNYRIFITAKGTSALDIQFRLRVGGADASGASNYLWHRDASFGSSSLNSDNTNSFFVVSVIDTVAEFPTVIDLSNPFIAQTTGVVAVGGRHSLGQTIVGYHNQATSYTGFTFFPPSGTITGSVSVYGYSK